MELVDAWKSIFSCPDQQSPEWINPSVESTRTGGGGEGMDSIDEEGADLVEAETEPPPD